MWQIGLLGLALLVVGCGEEGGDEGESEVSAAAFLTPAELTKGTKLKTLTRAEAKDKVENESDFYNTKPDSGSQSDDDDCLTSELSKLPIKATQNTLTMAATVDLSACLQKTFDASTPGLKVSKGELKMAFSFGCDNDDLSALNGKTYADIKNGDVFNDTTCSKATKLSELVNGKFTLSASGKVQNVDFVTETMSYFATSTADIKPCTATVSGDYATYDDGCLKVSREQTLTQKVNGTASDDEGRENFQSLAYQALQESKKGKWYKGGKMGVTFNEWTGSVSFKGDDTPPTYSLKNGDQTLEGALALTADPGPTPPNQAKPVEGALGKQVAKALQNIKAIVFQGRVAIQ